MQSRMKGKCLGSSHNTIGATHHPCQVRRSRRFFLVPRDYRRGLGSLCQKAVEIIERIREPHILRSSLRARSSPPTHHIRVFPKEATEHRGSLAPSLDANCCDELVQSGCLRVLPRACKRIEGDPKRGTSEVDELRCFNQPPLATGASTKLVNKRATGRRPQFPFRLLPALKERGILEL